MPSIHGICFDEGQRGNCGFKCSGLLEGECSIPREVISPENGMDGIIQIIGIEEFEYQILIQSGKVTNEEICNRALEECGYKPT